jgi:hypothetical protein
LFLGGRAPNAVRQDKVVGVVRLPIQLADQEGESYFFNVNDFLDRGYVVVVEDLLKATINFATLYPHHSYTRDLSVLSIHDLKGGERKRDGE